MVQARLLAQYRAPLSLLPFIFSELPNISLYHMTLHPPHLLPLSIALPGVYFLSASDPNPYPLLHAYSHHLLLLPRDPSPSGRGWDSSFSPPDCDLPPPCPRYRGTSNAPSPHPLSHSRQVALPHSPREGRTQEGLRHSPGGDRRVPLDRTQPPLPLRNPHSRPDQDLLRASYPPNHRPPPALPPLLAS